MSIFSRFKGLLPVGWCWVSSEPLKLIYGAFMGLYRVVIISAPVLRLSARKKTRPPAQIYTFLAPFRLCPFVAFRGCVGVFVSLALFGRFGGFSLLGWCCGLFLLLRALKGHEKSAPVLGAPFVVLGAVLIL